MKKYTIRDVQDMTPDEYMKRLLHCISVLEAFYGPLDMSGYSDHRYLPFSAGTFVLHMEVYAVSRNIVYTYQPNATHSTTTN
jgi:hypothetical protein